MNAVESKNVSRFGRRDFLRTAGTVAAVGATVGSLGLARNAFGAPTTVARAASAPRAAAGIKPGPDNTGVLPGSSLTVVNGSMTITTPGTVLQNLDIRGNVWVRANNVTIRNCYIRGEAVTPPGNSVALIMQYSSTVTGLLIEDSTIIPQSPSQSIGCILATNITVRRCNVAYGVDGIDAMGIGNVLVDSCYIHDGGYFTPSTGHSDNQSHSDGAQITNGTNVVYTNNTIVGFFTSCFMIGQAQGPLTGLKIMNNWVDGGAAAINLNSGNFGRFSPVITGNRFGRSRPRTYQILAIGQTDLTYVTGNVWDDNGQPVSIVVK